MRKVLPGKEVFIYVVGQGAVRFVLIPGTQELLSVRFKEISGFIAGMARHGKGRDLILFPAKRLPALHPPVHGNGIIPQTGKVAAVRMFQDIRKKVRTDHFRLADPAQQVCAYRAVAKALEILARKAGVYGMIGGQCADIRAEGLPAQEVTQDLLLYIHENKTAALIEAAMMIGAVLAGAGAQETEKIEGAARRIGVAFQIQDDILDVTGSAEVLGKQTGSDEKNHKVTYVSLNGIEKSRKDVERLSGEALETLRGFPERSEFLEQLVESLINRRK